MANFKKNTGFSLIEIIFVIAIISVVIVLGLSYTSKLDERTKEKTAALQIQQILQAGISYYVQNKRWPDAGNSANNSSIFLKSFVPAYESVKYNPWKINTKTTDAGYEWSYSDSSPASGVFEVRTNVPDEDTAKRIAALLPNAYVYTGDTVVNSLVSIPGAKQQGYVITAGSFYIKAANGQDDCSLAPEVLTKDQAASCTGKGMHLQIITTIQALHMKFEAGMSKSLEPKIIFNGVCSLNNGYGVSYTLRGDHPGVTSQFLNIYGSEGGKDNVMDESSSISYMAICLPGSAPSTIKACPEDSNNIGCVPTSGYYRYKENE